MIAVRDLVKEFRVSKRRPGLKGALAGLVSREESRVRALDGLSFEIGRGELVGFIGPNGAGKSTTLKVLSGILVPDSGQVLVGGRVPWKDRIAHVRRIGAVFGQRSQLWWDLPARESFDILGAMYGVGRMELAASLDYLVGALELGPLLDSPVRQLSLGQRMRCELAAALLHSPEILFLDEPSIGLDAQAKLAMRDIVRRLNAERGTTVILTTHDMDDVEALARRILLVGKGRLLFSGGMDELRRVAREERRLVLDLQSAERATELAAEPGRDPRLRLESRSGARVVLSYDHRALPTGELLARLTARYPIADLVVESEPVDRLIARLYGEDRA